MRKPIRPTVARTAAVLGLAGALAAGAAPVQAAPAAQDGPPARGTVCRGYVGLTFDDGPSDRTPALLTALRRAGLRATMFNQGNYATERPELVRAQVAAGMWIGNHSYTHPHLTQLTPTEVESEIARTQRAIAVAGGGLPRLFRPPYGETDAVVKAAAAKYGLKEILWDVDPQDWNNASADTIVEAAGRLTDGQVILLHDWPANTLEAVPRIGQALRANGLCAGRISPVTGRAVAPLAPGGPHGPGGPGGPWGHAAPAAESGAAPRN